MKTVKLNALTTVTALFAGIAVNGVPATAAAAESGLAPELVRAMRRDLGLDEAQLQRRLAFEAKAPAMEAALSEKLGERFGGAWLNEEGTQLIVGVTDEASAEQVREAGAEPRYVKHSKAHLERIMADLDRNAAKAPASVHSWYVDVATNTVVVRAESHTTMLASRARAFVGLSSGAAEEGALRVEPSTEAPRPVYDTRGGDAYFTGNARCSIGFSVHGGFLTAGHCGGVGTAVRGHNNVDMGTVRGSTFPTNDWAWVATNGSWASQPWVNNYNNGVITVRGSAETGIGGSICRSGSTTNFRCGVLQATNVTINYSNGPVYGMSRTNACANPGDSGGAVLSGEQAQGMTSGIAGGCESGDPQTFFQPINPALRNYGLTLVTSGGAPPSNGGKGLVSRMNGKCIDVPNGNFSDGVQVQMWSCNGSNAQLFAWNGSRLTIGGKCLDVSGASTANGARIQLANCNGNRAQDFVISAAGDLVSYLANKCVDIEGFNANDGAKLSIYTCTGTANQKWDYK